eukprot:5238754-Ditylum_brightwellii.AAC.1
MEACCSNHHNTDVNYMHNNRETDNTEEKYVYTGGEGEQGEDKYYKPVAPKTVTSVETDPSVKEIGNGAFFQWKKIKSIIIPDNVEVVGEYAFLGCITLSTVDV